MFTMFNEVELDDVIVRAREMETGKRDVVTRIEDVHFYGRQVTFTESSLFGVTTARADELESHALQQLCGRVGLNPMLPHVHIGRNPDWLYEAELNYWIQQYVKTLPENPMRSSEWYMRMWDTGEGWSTVRSVMSGIYSPVNNLEVLEAAQQVIDREGLHVTAVRPYISRDEMRVKLMLATMPGDPEGRGRNGNFGIGVSLENNEVGGGSLWIKPLIQRTSCRNSIVISGTDYVTKMRHAHHSVEEMLVQVRLGVGKALHVGTEGIRRISQAALVELPPLTDLLDKLGARYSVVNTARDAIVMGMEGESTQMGLVNGLSFAAHRHGFDNEEPVKELEELAGLALFAPASVGIRIR